MKSILDLVVSCGLNQEYFPISDAMDLTGWDQIVQILEDFF